MQLMGVVIKQLKKFFCCKEILNLSTERLQLVPGIINFKRHTEMEASSSGMGPKISHPC